MRFFASTVALAFIAAVVQAAPTPVSSPYSTPFEARITFIGAADAQFVQFFPADGRDVTISMSYLSSIWPNSICLFFSSQPSIPLRFNPPSDKQIDLLTMNLLTFPYQQPMFLVSLKSSLMAAPHAPSSVSIAASPPW